MCPGHNFIYLELEATTALCTHMLCLLFGHFYCSSYVYSESDCTLCQKWHTAAVQRHHPCCWYQHRRLMFPLLVASVCCHFWTNPFSKCCSLQQSGSFLCHRVSVQEAKKESAARHAEAAAARSALREAQPNSPSSQPLSHMQADMAQLRSAA